MIKSNKYYVVWIGIQPGIYSSWETAKLQIMGYPNARYQSFKNLAEAEEAFQNGPSARIPKEKTKLKNSLDSKIIRESISVDAACSGNPGILEYRGVHTATGKVIFHQGPFAEGTNNIGEFLALVHALALLQKNGKPTYPIYSDSKIAINWVKNKEVKTKLAKTHRNTELFELIHRALEWLNKNTYKNPIYKWETEQWGEIPADFGRK